MKKRARRFKQKKKIIDPQRRYEQFKKQDETSSWKNVKTIKKSDNTSRLDYTQGRTIWIFFIISYSDLMLKIYCIFHILSKISSILYIYIQ